MRHRSSLRPEPDSRASAELGAIHHNRIRHRYRSGEKPETVQVVAEAVVVLVLVNRVPLGGEDMQSRAPETGSQLRFLRVLSGCGLAEVFTAIERSPGDRATGLTWTDPAMMRSTT